MAIKAVKSTALARGTAEQVGAAHRHAGADAARLIKALTTKGALAEPSRHLVLKDASGPPHSPRVVASNDAAAITDHVDAACSRQVNAFWTANPVRVGWTGAKPTKVDITRIVVLTIDLDAAKPPPKASGQEVVKHWKAQRAAMKSLGDQIASLPEDVRPTAIVFTGNGLQLHFKLAQPLAAIDTAAADAMETRWRDEVLCPIGADRTQNRDRLVRLLGPNIKTGRPKGRAYLISADGRRVYSPDDFDRIREALLGLPDWPTPPSPPPVAVSGGGQPTKKASPGGRTAERDLSEQLLPHIPRWKQIDRAGLSREAADLLLASRTIFARLGGNTDGLDGTGSSVLLSLAGAVKAKGGSIGAFGELAYVCAGSRAHLDKHDTDRKAARALARAWLNSAANDAGFDENALAREFAARQKDKLLYDHSRGCWMVWTGDHWAKDDKGHHVEACRALAEEMATSGSKKRGFSNSKIKGALALAASDPRLATTREHFDTDAYLLGTPGATIELESSTKFPPSPTDMISQITAVKPADTANCPIWMRFLFEATGGDQQLIAFLQRLCGYCLTGDTKEQKFVFFYGPGGTGKSVFVNTVHRLLGDYAKVTDMDTFLSTNSSRHPTDLASLEGARFVSAPETQEGRRWDEPRIKRITGGDPIAARLMRQDFREFTPVLKLIVTGNVAPMVSSTDAAMRRRMIVVPFMVKPKNPDPDLEAKLRQEWPAILRWMVEGAALWQASGLQPPASAVQATDAVFGEADLFGRWLEDDCEIDDRADAKDGGYWTPFNRLFQFWQRYALTRGEDPGTEAAFARRLRDLGLSDDRRKVNGKLVRGRVGIRLRDDAGSTSQPDPVASFAGAPPIVQ